MHSHHGAQCIECICCCADDKMTRFEHGFGSPKGRKSGEDPVVSLSHIGHPHDAAYGVMIVLVLCCGALLAHLEGLAQTDSCAVDNKAVLNVA